ncbi:undecaprenyl-diphosphate phosphatase [Flexivirga sp. ID2601S]|uniref:Undecaprenyl-diphosphatase n=1 Tax=Flexivirga aerilata TaxID=1656889 RepID=A0A849AGN4_9MICO|nr:undecaprenyl-diphosphate phosphatase [Flexivirga aerilata]NNG38368.1 undecaprenyl-diphosphate phosphatase [Flexivirga aerilata]
MSDLSYLQSVTIGALQGVTELFPVSSLGHSILVPAWIGGSWKDLVTQQQQSGHTPFLAFIVALHVATALALIVCFWRDWLRVVQGLLDIVRRRDLHTARSRYALLLIVATIPVGIVGLIFEKPLRTAFSTPLVAAIFLTVNGGVLAIAELLTRASEASYRRRADHERNLSTMPWSDALIIGSSQILALMPGISRSGVTISTGLLRGFSHEKATKFALMLATPVILAAGVLKMPELAGPEASGIHGQVIVGMLVAFVAAFVATKFLTRFVRTHTLWPFVVYCLIAGIASIIRFA